MKVSPTSANFNVMDLILKLTLLALMIMQPLNACRLWAVCTRSDLTFPILSETEYDEIQDQLTTFYYQSETMLDGWALLSYDNSEQDSISPIYRSESPATNDSVPVSYTHLTLPPICSV